MFLFSVQLTIGVNADVRPYAIAVLLQMVSLHGAVRTPGGNAVASTLLARVLQNVLEAFADCADKMDRFSAYARLQVLCSSSLTRHISL